MPDKEKKNYKPNISNTMYHHQYNNNNLDDSYPKHLQYILRRRNRTKKDDGDHHAKQNKDYNTSVYDKDDFNTASYPPMDFRRDRNFIEEMPYKWTHKMNNSMSDRDVVIQICDESSNNNNELKKRRNANHSKESNVDLGETRHHHNTANQNNRIDNPINQRVQKPHVKKPYAYTTQNPIEYVKSDKADIPYVTARRNKHSAYCHATQHAVPKPTSKIDTSVDENVVVDSTHVKSEHVKSDRVYEGTAETKEGLIKETEIIKSSAVKEILESLSSPNQWALLSNPVIEYCEQSDVLEHAQESIIEDITHDNVHSDTAIVPTSVENLEIEILESVDLTSQNKIDDQEPIDSDIQHIVAHHWHEDETTHTIDRDNHRCTDEPTIQESCQTIVEDDLKNNFEPINDASVIIDTPQIPSFEKQQLITTHPTEDPEYRSSKMNSEDDEKEVQQNLFNDRLISHVLGKNVKTESNLVPEPRHNENKCDFNPVKQLILNNVSVDPVQKDVSVDTHFTNAESFGTITEEDIVIDVENINEHDQHMIQFPESLHLLQNITPRNGYVKN